MFRSIWILSIYIRAFMRRCMPTNVILNLIRRRQGLKWGVPAMALAVPFLLIAFWCVNFTAAGGPGWVNLVTLVALWNMMKFIAIGPASLVLLFAAVAMRRGSESSAKHSCTPKIVLWRSATERLHSCTSPVRSSIFA